MSDRNPLVTNSTGESSGYQSIDRSTQQHDDNRNVNQNKPLRHNKLCLRLGCTIVLTIILVILLPVFIGCTTYFHNKDAACYSAIPQLGVFTRSDAYSILYSTSTLSCLEKPIGIEIILRNNNDDEAASVEIYQTLCESIEKRSFRTSWNKVNVSVNQPTPVFSEDLSSTKLNYFINGSIKVDMIDITTSLSSEYVGVKLCLFTNNDDFQAFRTSGADWKNFIKNAECLPAQVKTGDSNSTTFHISEPTFAFVAMAATGNLSIGNLTVTTNGLGLFGPGENSTKVCQLNGKHPMCNFSLISYKRKEVCLVAHDDQQLPGEPYHYSNLIIKFTTNTNVGFWICLAVLLFNIIVCIVMSFCMTWTVVIYTKRKRYQLIAPAQDTGNQSTLIVSIAAHCIQNSDKQLSLEMPIPADQPVTNRNSPERDTQSVTNRNSAERDTETPPEEIGACVPILDTQPQEQCMSAGKSIHGTQTSIERTIRVQAETNDQSTTTAPSGNVTEPNTQSEPTQAQESQGQPTVSEQDTLSSEPNSRPIFGQPTPEHEPDNIALFVV